MSRKPRIHYPGAFYHALNRGNQRSLICWDETDYQQMLESLALASQRYQLRIHAYCLMPNHFHLLVQVDQPPLGLAMRSIETRYARHHNRRHRQVGHVFQARYRAILCDKDRYLLELVRYLHLNPVRAGLVCRPEEWLWSSHRAYVGLEARSWLYRDDVLAQFGRSGAAQLVEFLKQAPDLESRQEYYRPERFPLLGESRIPAGQEPCRKAGHSYAGTRLGLEDLAAGLAKAEGVSVRALQGRSEQRRLVAIRDQLVYAARQYFFYPPVKVAGFLGRTASAITYSERRAGRQLSERPELEKQLQQLLLKL